MKNEHINEKEIQQYILAKDDCDINIIEHINHCQKCKAEVELYKLLFAAIKKEPNPVFEFDLVNLVMQQVSEKQNFSFDKYLIAILSGVSIAVISILIYLTNKYFPTLFNGISFIQFSLIAVTILLISIFIYIDMNKNYKDQMNFS
ncbi:hypothetical protein Aeqsu_3163 [Aequorivita sublithincola DSM 14238]|uniref:Uncharacterized protein n=1 Tax=Aequorivita sublithincola (strain DSM 14238 / LMG 21431 / ACAM 643 / 9-3) TaxID=746697 RepID=I3Z029_AEQSU|nr:hypothetical protein [Aequorivita sublithincola]AFL82597.1 hypothetical protein Aeqsu_3163 [Aequorivita sublithincola DSM 14238]